MSVTVDLKQLWLTRTSNLRDALVLPIAPGSTEAWPNNDTVEEWAAGRFRPNGRDGLSRIWTPQLLMLTQQQRTELQARAGVPHWARDPWGGKVACTWSNPMTTYVGVVLGRGAQQMAQVALTLVEFTHAEIDDFPPYYVGPR